MARSPLPFPPLSAAGGWSSGHGGLFTFNSERIAQILTVAAIIWLFGLLAFLSFGNLGGSGGVATTLEPHSHRADLQPRGQIAATRPSGHAGGAHEGVDAEPQVHSRGFGFNKLASLQHELQHELHNMFEHEEEGEQDEEPVVAKPDKVADSAAEEAAQKAAELKLAAAEAAAAEAVRAKAIALSAQITAESKRLGEHPVTTSPAIIGGGMSNPAVVILTYTRRHYLLRTLDSLVSCPGIGGFKIYVSQDGRSPDLTDLPAKYSGANLHLLHHPREALLTPDQSGTAYLAQHYKWVLDKLFLQNEHSHVVIMEDDMIVSPDFITLFTETAPLMDSDPTIMCVSSWNDNGMQNLVKDNRRLMRTDYFPGLGWMTNRAIWEELSPKFPLDQWDHFMRLDTTYQGRDCLIPEVARNHNIGEQGTNMGDNFFMKFLANVAFNKEPVSFLRTQPDQPDTAAPNLEHMRSANYERSMHDQVSRAHLLGNFAEQRVQVALQRALDSSSTSPKTLPTTATAADKELAALVATDEDWLVVYDRADYVYIANMFGLLTSPRSGHKGLSSLRIGTHLVYFADIKKCPYIPASLRFIRDPAMVATVAHQNEACSVACARQGGECLESHFEFINECSALLKAFPCVKGCRGGVAGLDVPNYVDNVAKQELYGYCLTTDEKSTCTAKHWSASRLCPCKMSNAPRPLAPPAAALPRS